MSSSSLTDECMTKSLFLSKNQPTPHALLLVPQHERQEAHAAHTLPTCCPHATHMLPTYCPLATHILPTCCPLATRYTYPPFSMSLRPCPRARLCSLAQPWVHTTQTHAHARTRTSTAQKYARCVHCGTAQKNTRGVCTLRDRAGRARKHSTEIRKWCVYTAGQGQPRAQAQLRNTRGVCTLRDRAGRARKHSSKIRKWCVYTAGQGRLRAQAQLKNTQVVCVHCGTQGRPRARVLLLDWLVELAANYHAALHAPTSPPKTQQQRAQHLLRFPVRVGD